jgi:hypothetical protein
MHCTRVGMPGNAHAIFCMDRPRARTCSVCGVKARHYKLCDYPIANRARKTCDAPLCTSCAVHHEPDTDYCPVHAAASEGRLKL